MEVNSETKFRNSLWRKVSEKLSKERVVGMARTFKETLAQLFVCGRGKLPLDNDIGAPYDNHSYIEADIKDDVIVAPTEVAVSDGYPRLVKETECGYDRRTFLNKQQIKMKLFDLERRFKEQQEIIDKHKEAKPIKMKGYDSQLTDEKVRELNAIACDIWRRRSKVDHSKCKLDWDWAAELKECGE